MATTWSRMMSRFGMVGLFAGSTLTGIWFGCAGTNPVYDPNLPGGSKPEVPMGCVKTPEEDLPDEIFKDSNCDGIDGDRNKGIFVAPGGDDLNPGSPESPVKTIAAAIKKADEMNAMIGQIAINAIFVGRGDYNETVVLKPGISLYGGYDSAGGWTRAKANVSRVLGPAVAVRASNLDRETHIALSGFPVSYG